MKAHCDILSDKLEHERLAFESEIKAIRRDTEQFCQVERIHKEALLKYDKKMKENSYSRNENRTDTEGNK
uniref:CCDC92 domain-containing protein n=1 Tax=Mesocestoides corti TaxID=53468 RepID=A0A5K3F215_MESCO